MKRVLIFVVGLFAVSLAGAWGRIGDSAQEVTVGDTGDRRLFYSVAVGTTTPVLVYSGSNTDREVFIQNTSTDYNVYLGSSSHVSATSGDRVILRKNQDVTSNNSADLYAIAESSAGASGVTLVGVVEYDSKD